MIEASDARVDALAYHNALIKEMIEQEPELLLVLKTAALSIDARNRWHMYEELKRRGYSLVGWDARASLLQTTEHYEAFINAIDSLLPQEECP